MSREEAVKDMARHLIQIMSEQYHKVVLVGAPMPLHMGHMVRMAVNKNPSWYSDLYWSKKGTVKRKRLVRSFEKIAEGKKGKYCHDDWASDLVEGFVDNGYEDIPPY